MRLGEGAVSLLPAAIARPGYDRAAQACGIVHFGIGAFHRAHQAVYTDDAMNGGDRNWGIVGVSLRSDDARGQLAPQAGLYTLTARGGRDDVRLIGAVKQVLVAPEAPDAIVAAIASPATKIVSLTITEKGYQRGAEGGLDLAAPDLAGDLAGAAPRTIFGFIQRGLHRRRSLGLPGVTLVSCDNLAQNGAQLSALLEEFLERRDSGLRNWFRAECACPSSMVDRIVPAVTGADRDLIAQSLGMRDEAAIVTEPFRQWIVEDKFAGPRPCWEAGGAEFVADVRPYETAKLRMLNGAHSALAYLGLARGYAFVHEAIADPELLALANVLMREEAAVSFSPAPGQDLNRYADALLARFANSGLPHKLAQIAMDGSQKIPQRWLETLAARQREGAVCPALLKALVAWVVFVRGDRYTVDDPMAATLADLWRRHGRIGIAAALFGDSGLFSRHWSGSAAAATHLVAEIALLK